MTETEPQKDPFDFLFYYEFDTGEIKENALLVGDDPTTASPLHLAIGVKEAKEIIIRPLPGVTTASSSNYHFKLQFNPGILLKPKQITVDSNDWDLKVEEDTILYLIWKGEEVTLTEDNSIEIILNDVMATLTSAMPKTTTTNVILSWELERRGIIIIQIISRAPGETNPYNTNFSETLEMIQRQGQAIPLYVGFFSSNRVLNTNNQESELKLRITNMSDSPITFNYSSDATSRSQLVVALEVGTVSDAPWALGTQDQVNDVVVSIDGDKWQSSARPTPKGKMLEWTFSPKSANVELASQDTVVINLSKIVTAHPTGMTNLYLRSQYVPGYQDGEFICQIEKAPLVFPETKVGIGTTVPAESLHIHEKGNIRLDNGEIQNKGSLLFRSDVDKTSDLLSAQFFKQNETTPLMVLDKDGKLGIGTKSPTAKLQINGTGTTFLSGNGTTNQVIIKDGNVGIGTTSPQAKLEVEGEVLVKGRIKDKTGYVMPVGSILPYAGSTAPEGWLLCDGIQHDNVKYKDLFDLILYKYGGSGGSFGVPNLKGKVPVGLSTDTEFNDLGKTGGEKTHTLTISEMPSHNHDVDQKPHDHPLLFTGNSGNGDYIYRAKPQESTYRKHSQACAQVKIDLSIKNTGGQEAHNNLQPYIIINYIIKY